MLQNKSETVNCNQGHISELDFLDKEAAIIEYNTFNTDIDPESEFMESSPGPSSIEVSSGSGFRKPGPGCSLDSSYVREPSFFTGRGAVYLWTPVIDFFWSPPMHVSKNSGPPFAYGKKFWPPLWLSKKYSGWEIQVHIRIYTWI